MAVALLGAGVAGGYYLGEDREIQEQGIEQKFAYEADQAEMRLVKQHHGMREIAAVKRRTAEAMAQKKAAEAVRAAAERARRAEEVSRAKRAAEAKEAKEAEEQKAEDDAPAKPYAGPIPESCNELTGNRETGCAIMLDRGFKMSQWPCLNKLWNKESGWNHKAYNEGSGAYGIPQALPGSKMESAGDDWKTNPATQIKWGLGYIKGRYGNPCGAWEHSEDVGWY